MSSGFTALSENLISISVYCTLRADLIKIVSDMVQTTSAKETVNGVDFEFTPHAIIDAGYSERRLKAALTNIVDIIENRGEWSVDILTRPASGKFGGYKDVLIVCRRADYKGTSKNDVDGLLVAIRDTGLSSRGLNSAMNRALQYWKAELEGLSALELVYTRASLMTESDL